MTITTRAGKGSELTHNELDTNFTDLRDGVNLMTPKQTGYGMKIGPNGSETFGWYDLLSTIHVDPDSLLKPSFVTYRGNIKGRQFAENNEAFIEFHIPHDYLPGSQLFIHTHWSHNSALVTGGSTTWGFEIIYAKGHNQQAFGTPITVSALDNASTIQYQHQIAEVPFTTNGGSGVSLDVAQIEVDGVIMCRVFLDSNDITVSGGGIPSPFVHFVDVHYQSTNVATKNRAPGFYD